ncbi:MAG: TonB-dependent receptor [Oligoflexus sp.]
MKQYLIYSVFIAFPAVIHAEDSQNDINNRHTSTQELPAETMVITGTREARGRSDAAESIDVLSRESLEDTSPAHPADVLNRLSGVHISNIGGEGHMTAIRQPISTSGVYLFLEDGIPTRPTGFFNHNGLYEVNIPQADRLEITKGPSSSLYGSDAIGGTIHSVTRESPEKFELRLNPELGSFGWQRWLLSSGKPIGAASGVRFDLNLTRNEGYRESSEYERVSATLRLDGHMGDHWSYKTILSYTLVDQSGVSGLTENDYQNNTRKNRFHGEIGFRDVSSWRLSSEFSYEADSISLWTLTPFIRKNTSEMMPSWMIGYDPNITETNFESYGLLAKYRRRLPDQRLEWIAGVDIDHTPASYQEDQISVALDSEADIYRDYERTGRRHYEYDATQTSISPYLNADWRFADAWLANLGLRYDFFRIDYKDRLSSDVPERVEFRSWFRPESQDLEFEHLSPKLGLIYNWAAKQFTYVNYRRAFRAPAVGQLFRAGSNTNTVELKPVKADSIELGFRGLLGNRLQYDLAIYQMDIQDDIVNIIEGSDRKLVNAGQTRHEGLELGIQAPIAKDWALSTGWTWTRQEYKNFQYVFSCFPPACVPPVNETRNFSGYRVGKAPETMGSLAVQYFPSIMKGLRIELQWEHVGAYYTDETNTQTYGGHDLANLRASYQISDGLHIYGRVMNVGDRLYSVYTSNQVGSEDIEYRPGLPRSYFLGLRAQL